MITAQQTAGRGRAGRNWITKPGSALLCSLLLRPSLPVRQISSLPLVIGLAIAEALDAVSGARCRLKWPNDVYLEGKKVCGVLAQSRSIGERIDFVNLGFGINVNARPDELPEGATSLYIETGYSFPLAAVEQAVLAAIERRYSEFLASKGRPSLADWTKRALYLGEAVSMQLPSGEMLGRFAGVADDGAALIETPDGVQHLAIGELTRGPRPVGAT